jgi:hypothetical protein
MSDNAQQAAGPKLAENVAEYFMRSELSRVNALGLIMIRTSNAELNKALIVDLLNRGVLNRGDHNPIQSKTDFYTYLYENTSHRVSLIYKNKNGRYKIKECKVDRSRYNFNTKRVVLVDEVPHQNDFSKMGILTPIQWNKSILKKIQKNPENGFKPWEFDEENYSALISRFGDMIQNEMSPQTQNAPNKSIRARIKSKVLKVARFGRAVKRNVQNYIVAPFGGKLAQMSISKKPKRSVAVEMQVQHHSRRRSVQELAAAPSLMDHGTGTNEH